MVDPDPITATTDLLLTISGPAAEYQGHRLGLFSPEGWHAGRPYWRQWHTTGAGEGQVLHWSGGDYQEWRVGPTLDGPVVGLRNTRDTDLPPREGTSVDLA